MIRSSTLIAITLLLPPLARAEDATVRCDVDEQPGPDDQDQDDRDRPAGLPNCNEAGALPCFEVVWVDGIQRKMAFFDLDVQTNPPTHNFYVVAPQTGTPQGIAPFLHDHVVGDGGTTLGAPPHRSTRSPRTRRGCPVAARGGLPFAPPGYRAARPLPRPQDPHRRSSGPSQAAARTTSE